MWDLIVSVPDYCLSFYFILKQKLDVELISMYQRKNILSFSENRR